MPRLIRHRFPAVLLGSLFAGVAGAQDRPAEAAWPAYALDRLEGLPAGVSGGRLSPSGRVLVNEGLHDPAGGTTRPFETPGRFRGGPAAVGDDGVVVLQTTARPVNGVLGAIVPPRGTVVSLRMAKAPARGEWALLGGVAYAGKAGVYADVASSDGSVRGAAVFDGRGQGRLLDPRFEGETHLGGVDGQGRAVVGRLHRDGGARDVARLDGRRWEVLEPDLPTPTCVVKRVKAVSASGWVAGYGYDTVGYQGFLFRLSPDGQTDTVEVPSPVESGRVEIADDGLVAVGMSLSVPSLWTPDGSKLVGLDRVPGMPDRSELDYEGLQDMNDRGEILFNVEVDGQKRLYLARPAAG